MLYLRLRWMNLKEEIPPWSQLNSLRHIIFHEFPGASNHKLHNNDTTTMRDIKGCTSHHCTSNLRHRFKVKIMQHVLDDKEKHKLHSNNAKCGSTQRKFWHALMMKMWQNCFWTTKNFFILMLRYFVLLKNMGSVSK